uniref:PDEase domain-containing protein n=1 Tax=Pyrodinium bahamense TaxID=73915 RepID=A0A7R9ZWQ3_9DINO
MDVFLISERSSRCPLSTLGRAAVLPLIDTLGLDPAKAGAFLESIEERYNPEVAYHNSTHAADVLNNLLYFLRLLAEPLHSFEPMEKLTGLLVAGAHDVGHPGRANRYHTAAQSPLALLFNDQSVLENMHCAIMFAVLRVEASNLLEGLDLGVQAAFRNLAIQMILNTDLAKHVKAVSAFRQEFLDLDRNFTRQVSTSTTDGKSNQSKRKDLLSFLLKCSDVGGSAKHFSLHVNWTMRIFCEFYDQGDAESALGLPCSPFCNRTEVCLHDCQHGFFAFVVAPMFNALSDYLHSQRLQFEVINQMERNHEFWRTLDDDVERKVDHGNPLANVPLLTLVHRQQQLSINTNLDMEDSCSFTGHGASPTLEPRFSNSSFGSEPWGSKTAQPPKPSTSLRKELQRIVEGKSSTSVD